MNARKRQVQEPQDHHSMKGPIVKSALFHAAIFLVALIGFPFVAKDTPVITPVSVELVDISDMTRTNKVAPPQKEPEKPKEIEAPKPPQEKPEPPKQVAEKLPEPKPPEPPKPKEPEKKPEPPKEALAPPKPEKKEPEKKPEPPKPKPPEPKKQEKQEDDFASLLKNLTPTESKPAEKSTEEPVEDAEPAAGQLAELSDRLTISELDAFKRQLEPCWNVPAGAEYAENLAVEVRVIMHRDMTVQDASVLDKARYNRDRPFRAAADSALRALRNPRCQPLKLPPDKYNEWKTIIINFDPSEML